MKIIRPEKLHYDIFFLYKEVLSVFIRNVIKFQYLEENQVVNSENMSIQCLRKNTYSEKEYYMKLWWNHYQKGEDHFIEINKEENLEPHVTIISTTYQFSTLTDNLIDEEPSKLYEMYLSLYYANVWFAQLV